MLGILRIIEDIIMHLKCDAQMGSKVKQPPLGINIEIVYDAETSTAQGDHRSSFVIGLGDVRGKVLIEVILIVFLPLL